jgi:hypothetical protein
MPDLRPRASQALAIGRMLETGRCWKTSDRDGGDARESRSRARKMHGGSVSSRAKSEKGLRELFDHVRTAKISNSTTSTTRERGRANSEFCRLAYGHDLASTAWT